MKRGRNIDRFKGASPIQHLLLQACEESNVEQARDNILCIRHKGYNINWTSSKYSLNTALHLAANANCVDIVELLLAYRSINVNLQNDRGETALMIASRNGNARIVSMLLAKDGINPQLKDKNLNTALAAATGSKHESIIRLLLYHDGINL